MFKRQLFVHSYLIKSSPSLSMQSGKGFLVARRKGYPLKISEWLIPNSWNAVTSNANAGWIGSKEVEEFQTKVRTKKKTNWYIYTLYNCFKWTYRKGDIWQLFPVPYSLESTTILISNISISVFKRKTVINKSLILNFPRCFRIC